MLRPIKKTEVDDELRKEIAKRLVAIQETVEVRLEDFGRRLDRLEEQAGIQGRDNHEEDSPTKKEG